MLYPILPAALRQDYEARVAEWRSKQPPPPQEYAVSIDFADFNRQRYSALSRAKVVPGSAPIHGLRDRVRNWIAGCLARGTA